MLSLLATLSARLAPSPFNAEALSKARYVTQPVDHFSTTSATWSQAYFVNRKHWSGGESAPVFLYVGGEGPLSSFSVTSNFIVDWLPNVSGLMFALEHRYYGCHNVSSCPYTPGAASSAAEEMKWLSTEQALADLASFRDYALKAYGVPAGAPWVAIGGSYPGMLAAFVRATYPDRFAASVASSAPVHGLLDFRGFQDAIATAYEMSTEGARGSLSCTTAIADGHSAVAKALQDDEGRRRLASLFAHAVPSAAWLELDRNRRTFAGCGVASFPAQANDPQCTAAGCGVTQICEIMTDSGRGEPLERLAALAKAQHEGRLQMTGSCEMDWEMPGDIPVARRNYWGWQCRRFIMARPPSMRTAHHASPWLPSRLSACVKHPGSGLAAEKPQAPQSRRLEARLKRSPLPLPTNRQCCTEYGFYQTCEEGSKCFYAQGLVSFDDPRHRPDDYCAEQFGVARADSAARIAARDARYTRLVANATRILWVNGDVDPWHSASNLKSPGEDQPTIWPVRGAHHCAWMSSYREGEQPSVTAARDGVYAQLERWLATEASAPVEEA